MLIIILLNVKKTIAVIDVTLAVAKKKGYSDTGVLHR